MAFPDPPHGDREVTSDVTKRGGRAPLEWEVEGGSLRVEGGSGRTGYGVPTAFRVGPKKTKFINGPAIQYTLYSQKFINGPAEYSHTI